MRDLDRSGRQLTSLPVVLEEHLDIEVPRLDDDALSMAPAGVGRPTRLVTVDLRWNVRTPRPDWSGQLHERGVDADRIVCT